MKKINFKPALLLIAGLILAACAKPPVDEMNKAEDAVIRAENDADAVTYAPNILVRARDALTRMQSEADAKRYDEAKNFAAEAVSNAEKAIADGKAGAERVRQEAENIVNNLQGPLAETFSALDTARKNNIPLNFDALVNDANLASQTYDNALDDIQAGNYRDAIGKAETARSLLAGVNSRLTEAAQVTSRKQ